MTGISIIQHVVRLLQNNPNLNKYVNNKIYPLIAVEDTTFPFIVVQRDSISTEYIKDNPIADNVTISINIACNTYKESVDIAEEVRLSVEGKQINNISEIRMLAINEDFIENTYIQNLVFTFQVRL